MMRGISPTGSVRTRDDAGAVAVISGIVAVVLMLVSAFVIDLGSTWARRGDLQVQADKAALLAARNLPATDGPSKLKAAKYVAYYFACHTLPGQRQLHPEIPECPSGTAPGSASILTYASQLLADGSVTFPKSTQVKVLTPQARIDYGFGKLAGVEGSTQRKMSIAQVSSPGSVVPMGLSVPCLLSAVGNVPNAGNTGILPINYVTPGALTPSAAPATVWPSAYDTTTGGPALSSIGTVPNPVVSGPTPATFTVTGSNWGILPASVQVAFHKGPDTGTPAQAASVNVLGTSATGLLPDTVMQNPGTWEVKVGVEQTVGGAREWSNPIQLNVTVAGGTTDLVGCGRLLDSPRADEPDRAAALARNLQAGLDHPLVGHPNLVSVTAPTLSADDAVALATNPVSLFSCSSASPHVLDVANPGGTPNCVRLQGDDSWLADSFTEGMLGAESGGTSGRLVCSSTRPCTGPTATVRGVQINDDDFDQFVVDPGLLQSKLFFGLSTYLTNGLPILTPQNALSTDLYKSHRFMWVPVMSAPLTPTAGGDYPILTFRPIFVTQDAPSGWTAWDMLWDQVDTLVAALGLSEDDVQHGLLMSEDGQTLRAVRFMTIEPTSLPLVADTYDGPTTDYVGVGPKLVKLVK
jgi:hypothetical protein